MLCVLNMTKQDPALSQDFIAQKRSLTVFCENFAQIAKESISFELNLHGLLTIFGRLEKRRAVCLPPKQGLKMITGQSKAFHLGRWELLFKIMDEGSITRVADIENVQRSQLSRMVSGLEEELGIQLLERRGKRLNSTQAALELRSKIEPHITMVRRALEKTSELEEGDAGSIRFGAMPGFLQTQVVPLIAEFQQLHPQVTFDVIGDDNPKAFMGGECDLMLYYGPVNDANLVENWVTRSLFIPCASPKYLEKAGYPEDPAELSNHAGVVYTGRVRPHSEVLVKNGRQQTFRWNSMIRFNNILLAKTAAVEGCGIVLDMPLHHCYEEVMNGQLVPILNGWQIPNLDNYIGSTLAASKLKRVQMFIDFYVRRRREIEGEQKRRLQEKFSFII